MSCSISASSANATAQTNPFRQRMLDFQALGKALESGDLDAAKEAFASLQANAPKRPEGAEASGKDKLKADFDTLAKALEAGDLDDAKAAFAQLQTDMKAQRAAHGHHHKPKPDAATSNASAALDLTMSSFSITA